ncbi:hypothetical protein LZZ85_27795 [Terrimonas sp. NA20]|uniref:Gliding motility-associated protein GldM C-terminal domain-containing protein n=1 Tax=Terrimonas ginsenosidimutans TaxID=2908004 RepID=A0ABS9L0N4_9BACT|nr:hypothetical protein [Terrimonas ginsenosidimutans]MCG2618138.1 hypothetical protein [Terrimonas ginsenosidimutans]
MKAIIVIVMLAFVSLPSWAQCKENITGQQMKKGMYISTRLGQDAKEYAAEILSADGTSFSCRFLHSSSVYQFVDFKRASDGPVTRMQATVKSSKGGGFAAGTVFIVNTFMLDPEPCDLATAPVTGKFYDVFATFAADGKTYLARIRKNAAGYTVFFVHSSAQYTTDENFKVLTVKGGGYKVGSTMVVKHARILQF